MKIDCPFFEEDYPFYEELEKEITLSENLKNSYLCSDTDCDPTNLILNDDELYFLDIKNKLV